MSDWISYEARLTEGYRRCAKLTWRYGTTYFWGAALLPKPQRKHVHAIYALCRLADDIVDLPNGTAHRASEARANTSRRAGIEFQPSRTRPSLTPTIGKQLSATASRPSPSPSETAWPRATVPTP